MIMELANCSKEDAEKAYSETHDVVESVDRLLAKTFQIKEPVIPKVQSVSVLNNIRKTMEKFDAIVSNRRAGEVSVSKQCLREEMVLQNNYSQECQMPALE